MSAGQQQLEYAPGEPVRRRKRLKRAGVALIVAIIVLTGLWKGKEAYRRAGYWWSVRQAEAFVAPPDQVVYEEDRQAWAALLKDPAYRMSFTQSTSWNDFVQYWNPRVMRIFELNADPNIHVSPLAVFCHARKSAGGEKRLVVVSVPANGVRGTGSGASPDNQVEVDLRAMCLGGAKVKLQFVQEWLAPQSVAENRKTALYLRMWAGQVDLADASHFTIRYRIGEYEDELDGYLMDGDRVVMFPQKHRVWEGLPQEKMRGEWEQVGGKR